jgi:DNA invertase Pin-like site-specific DNA recombinase
MSKPMVAYLRVSTREQARSRLGIDVQRAAIAEVREVEGFQIVAEHVEIETGKGSDALERRPQLAAALAEARPNGRACPVAVSKLERLSRDVHFISGLTAHRTPFLVADLGSDGNGAKYPSPSRMRAAATGSFRNPLAAMAGLAANGAAHRDHERPA